MDLENAGERKDTAFIEENTDRLLLGYRTLDKKLSPLDQTDESLPPISPEAMKEAYTTILEIAESMDYEMMEELLKNLHGYRLSSSDEEAVSAIEKHLTALDWEAIRSAAAAKL